MVQTHFVFCPRTCVCLLHLFFTYQRKTKLLFRVLKALNLSFSLNHTHLILKYSLDFTCLLWSFSCFELAQKWSQEYFWCFWTVVLEKTLESPLDSKEIKPVHPKGYQYWIFIGKTGADAEVPMLWPSDVKSHIIGKDPDAGKDWGQEEKRATEDEMVGGHHWLNGHKFEQAPGDGEGQGSLARCSPWGPRVRHDLATKQQDTVNLTPAPHHWFFF